MIKLELSLAIFRHIGIPSGPKFQLIVSKRWRSDKRKRRQKITIKMKLSRAVGVWPFWGKEQQIPGIGGTHLVHGLVLFKANLSARVSCRWYTSKSVDNSPVSTGRFSDSPAWYFSLINQSMSWEFLRSLLSHLLFPLQSFIGKCTKCVTGLFSVDPSHSEVQGVHKKMSRSFCLIFLATSMLEGWDIILLKGGIYSFVWIAKIFLYDIREPRYKQIEMGYQISECLNVGQSSVLKADVPYCFTYILAPLCFTEMGLNFKHAQRYHF